MQTSRDAFCDRTAVEYEYTRFKSDVCRNGHPVFGMWSFGGASAETLQDSRTILIDGR